MHGDLEGIAGASLPAIKMLELPVDEQRYKLTKNQKGEARYGWKNEF